MSTGRRMPGSVPPGPSPGPGRDTSVRPRRRVGFALVGLVLLAALIVPAAAGRSIAGSAVAVPLAGPPAVGNCLTTAQPSVDDLQDLSAQFSSGPSGPLRYRSVPLSPCTGARYGEVVDVLADPGKIAASQDAGTGRTSMSDPNSFGCSTAVARYTGSARSRFSYWRVALAAIPVLVGPDERALRAGQHWAACLLVTPTATGSTAELAGSPVTVLTDGTGGDQLGSCQNGPAPAPTPSAGSCAFPHRTEILGQAYGPALAGVTRSELTRTCNQLVADLTGKPDITVTGALRVAAPVFADGDARDYGKPTTATSIALCAVSAADEATLGGSLLGLGQRPIPWS